MNQNDTYKSCLEYLEFHSRENGLKRLEMA